MQVPSKRLLLVSRVFASRIADSTARAYALWAGLVEPGHTPRREWCFNVPRPSGYALKTVYNGKVVRCFACGSNEVYPLKGKWYWLNCA